MNIKVKTCDNCRFVTREYYISKCNCGKDLVTKTATITTSQTKVGSSVSGNFFLKMCNATYLEKDEITHIDGFLLPAPILLGQSYSSCSWPIDPGV